MKKIRLLGIFTAAALAVSMLCSCSNGIADKKTDAVFTETTELKKVTIEGTKFTVDGKELWINGVNTPWDKWNDFGGSFNEQFWDEHFSQLHEVGVNASRIWINCNGNTSIKLDENGNVTSVSSKHWEDLDKLFAIAEKYNIYLMPTFLSFDHFKDSNPGYKGWRAMVSSESATQTYIDSYVKPFVERYKNSPALWSVDLMNEPDWVVENSECGNLGWDIMSPFFARCTAAIHENSDVLVTVGLGMVKYNSDKLAGNYVSDEYFTELAGEKAYLDFYSTHYYFWQNSYMGFPFEETPEAFGLGTSKPCVIGETASIDESGRTITERYVSAYENGWNGVMAWTSNGVDNCGKFEDMQPAVSQIYQTAPEKVFPYAADAAE